MKIYDKAANRWVGLGEACTKVPSHQFTLKGERLHITKA